jgi:hypothetical protein
MISIKFGIGGSTMKIVVWTFHIEPVKNMETQIELQRSSKNDLTLSIFLI